MSTERCIGDFTDGETDAGAWRVRCFLRSARLFTCAFGLTGMFAIGADALAGDGPEPRKRGRIGIRQSSAAIGVEKSSGELSDTEKAMIEGSKRREAMRGASGIPYAVVRRQMEEIGRGIDGMRQEIEEWGTLSVSSPMFAMPDFPEGDAKTPVFAVGMNKPAAEWFIEAGKSEGSADFSERILNTLSVSGAVQSSPEAAFAGRLQRDKIATEQKLFEAEVAKRRLLEEEALADHQGKREALAEASRIQIQTTRRDADRALIERREADLIAQRQRATADAAQSTLRRKEAELARAQDALDAKPDDPDLTVRRDAAERARNEARTAADLATGDATAAEAELTRRRADETAASQKLVDALNASPGTVDLESTAKIPTESPTFDAALLPEEPAVGDALKAAKAAVADIPAVTRAKIEDLGDNSFATSTRPKDETTAFPARSRLIETAGNKTIQEIFNFLGDPAAALVFKDKPVLMGVATVSANPGWRTRRDYDGQVDVQATYSWVEARRETLERIVQQPQLFPPGMKAVAEAHLASGTWPRPDASVGNAHAVPKPELDFSTSAPLVMAVSPLMERQALDLTSSRARQDEMALFLSASLARSGLKGQAEVFDKFVKLRRQDVATRSVLPVLNAYNTGGGIFGFQFGSRLDALDKPGSRNPKAAQQLGKQAFPVLLMFGFTRTDIAPKLAVEKGTVRIYEPEIELVQTTRWSRQEKRGVFHSAIRSVLLPGFPGRPMQAPSDIYGRLHDVGEALNRFRGPITRHAILENNRNVAGWLTKMDADLEVMKAAYFGYATSVALPVDAMIAPAPKPAEPPKPEAFPIIAEVFPGQLHLTTPPGGTSDILTGRLVIVGKDLDRLDGDANPELLPAGVGEARAIRDALVAGGSQARAYEFSITESVSHIQLRLPVKPRVKDEPPASVFTGLIEVNARFEPRPQFISTPDRIPFLRQTFAALPAAGDAAASKIIHVEVWTKSRNLSRRDFRAAVAEVQSILPKSPEPPAPPRTVEITVEDARPLGPDDDDFGVVLSMKVPGDFQECTFILRTTARYRVGSNPEIIALTTQPITVEITQ